MFRNFDFCAEVESYSHHDPISSDFRENREIYVVYILDCWAVPGYSILRTVPKIRDSNMLKLGEFFHYKTKPALELLGVCEQTSNISGRF